MIPTDYKNRIANEKLEWLISLNNDDLRKLVDSGGPLPEILDSPYGKVNVDYFLREDGKGYIVDISIGGSFISKVIAGYYFEIAGKQWTDHDIQQK